MQATRTTSSATRASTSDTSATVSHRAASGSCAARLSFDGRPYRGVAIQDGSIQSAKETLGPALSPICGKNTSETLEAARLRGIEPRVAVGIVGQPEVMFIAEGRCEGRNAGRAGLVRCLRTTLRYNGADYVETRSLDREGVRRALGSGQIIRPGSKARSATVLEIGGVSPDVAVATAWSARGNSKSGVFVANDYCYFADPEEFLRCLVEASSRR